MKNSDLIEVAWFKSRRHDAYRCRWVLLKGESAEKWHFLQFAVLGMGWIIPWLSSRYDGGLSFEGFLFKCSLGLPFDSPFFIGVILLSEAFTALAYMGIPMLLIQLIYRHCDKSGIKTSKLVQRLNFKTKRKFILQIGSMFGVVLIFSAICMFFKLDASVFYIISGTAVGIIHSVSAAVMRNN